MCGEWGCYESFLMCENKRETVVFIFIHSEVFMCFYKIVYGYLAIRRYNIGYPLRGITENAEPFWIADVVTADHCTYDQKLLLFVALNILAFTLRKK